MKHKSCLNCAYYYRRHPRSSFGAIITHKWHGYSANCFLDTWKPWNSQQESFWEIVTKVCDQLPKTESLGTQAVIEDLKKEWDQILDSLKFYYQMRYGLN